MERIVLSPLPVKLDRQQLMEQNHIPVDSDLAEEFSDLIDAAERVLCCKAILKDAADAELNLSEGIKPRFLYAMTIGTEIEAEEDCDYPLLGDIVRQAALDCAMEKTKEYLRQHFGLKQVTFYNPGSTEGWGQEQNIPLFALLNAAEIGISCDQRGYMTPWYSTLGVFTEV